MTRAAQALVLASVAFASPAWAEPPRASPAVVTPAPAAAAVALAPKQLDGALEARRVKMLAGLKPGMRAKIERSVQEVLRRARPVAAAPGKTPPVRPDLSAVARSSLAGLGDISGADIEAMVLLVMMEAAKSAQEDLKSMLAEVNAINARKSALRAALQAMRAAKASAKPCAALECVAAIPPGPDFTRADLEAVKQTLLAASEDARAEKGREMTELEETRLQMYMDRRAKVMETLSNLMKKLNETQSGIIQNMK